MVKYHGENSQSAQAIELGQIAAALRATVAEAFFSVDTITSNAASEDSFIKVCSAQRQKFKPRVLGWNENNHLV